MHKYAKYVEYNQGNLPLIISVPHGGTSKIEEIPERKSGIRGIDKNTIEIAVDLIEHIKKIYNLQKNGSKIPSFVFSLVSRSKIDLNREKSKAFVRSSKLAEEIYQFFHSKLEEYVYHNLVKFDRSLLIDIHGFESNKRPSGYRDVELILGTNNLKTLFSEPGPKKEHGKNVRGKIIKQFNQIGIQIAPGHHLRREYVLTGGYITKKYGATNIKNSQSIQIEFSDKIRIHDKELRNKVLYNLAEIIIHELEKDFS
ncbi:MAG: N-formylglutamate amidohydrolase [Candidatus Lokiarchaeota archaeon]|nr:N-formylglutamate amidohydrolase [Candidatus Lokiarchaeota archaeon]